MAWSLTAPTLPSGSSWVQKDTISISNNQLDVTGTVFCARLADQGFALKIVETRTFHLTNPNFTDFYKTYHRCDVAGVTGNAYTESDFGNSGSTKTYYFTGIAEAGASIKVIVGVKADSSTQEISFTAPALLDGGDSGGGSSGGGTGGDSGGGSSGGTFSTTAPTNVVGWSAEVTGEWVSMYNYGKYGYAYRSQCAVTRLSDNSICVRIKMWSNAIKDWGPANQATYIPWGNNGTENEFGPSGKYNYGSGGYVAAIYYYTLPASYKGATVTAGMTCGIKPTTANSPVTLTVPEPVGNMLYLNTNGVWHQVGLYYHTTGIWKEAFPYININGKWK